MNRTMRLNSYPNKQRADEEAAGLRLAFEGHPLSRRHLFQVDVSPFQGEYHVNVSAEIDTSADGFLSVIVARVLASFCRAPATPMQLPSQRQSATALTAPRQRFGRLPRY